LKTGAGPEFCSARTRERYEDQLTVRAAHGTAPEGHDHISGQHRQVELMSREEDERLEFAEYTLQVVQELLPRGHIEGSKGLIKKKYPGRLWSDQSPTQVHQLTLAPTESVRSAFERQVEGEVLHEPQHMGTTLITGQTEDLQWEGNVIYDTAPREDRIALRDIAKSAARGRLTVDEDGAPISVQDACEQAEEGCLADTVWPDDGHDGWPVDLQRHSGKYGDGLVGGSISEALLELFNEDRGHVRTHYFGGGTYRSRSKSTFPSSKRPSRNT